MDHTTRAAQGLGSRIGTLAGAIAIVGVARLAGRSGSSHSDSRGRTSAGDTSGPASSDGKGAESPADIPAPGWRQIAMQVYEAIGKNRILAVAAGVTFYGLLALFPAIGAFVSLYGLVADAGKIGDQLATLSAFLPSGALDVIGGQIQRITSKGDTALGFAFFSGLAVSLWSANAGMKALFDALNVAYESSENRNFFWLNVQSLAFTFGAIVFLVLALSAVVVIPVVLAFVGLGAVTDWIVWAGRWPALLALLMVALAVLYRYGPSHHEPAWRWLAPGSLIAGFGWIVFSMLFSWYVGHFGTYNETYGTLGAVIGLMTWMWLSTTIVLVGAEVNAKTEDHAEGDTDTPAKRSPVKA